MKNGAEEVRPVYSDGTIEKRILDYIVQHNGDSANIIQDIPEGAVFHNFTSARNNLLNWYPFTKQDAVLEIGAGMGALTPYLASVCGRVVAVEPSADRAEIIRVRCKQYDNVQVLTEELGRLEPRGDFDYVLLVGVLEYAGIMYDEDPWLTMLREAKRFLKPSGKLLVAIENKYGLKYWCGAAEDHTGIPFDSINQYRKSAAKTSRYAQGSGVRTFSHAELKNMLACVGLNKTQFYYPLPDYKFPMLVLSDKSANAAMLAGSVKYTYPEESTLIANETELFSDIAENDSLGFFANSFLVEAMEESVKPSGVITALVKRDYKEEYRLTTIFEKDLIRREATSKAAERHLRDLEENTKHLQNLGIPCADQKPTETGGSVVELLEGSRADVVFLRALCQGNIAYALSMVDHLRSILLRSSESYLKDGQLVLKDGFVDLTFCNSFWQNNALLFFDQEWKLSDVPMNFILYRSIIYSCRGCEASSRDLVLQYCGISSDECVAFERMEKNFLANLMDETNCTWFDRSMYQKRLEMEAKFGAEIRNRELHIELLLQSERDLKAVILKAEHSHAEQMAAQERDHAERTAALKQEYAEQLTIREQEYTEQRTIMEQEYTEQLAALQQTLRNKEGHIALLLESDRELERIKSSRSWRFMGYAWKMRDALVPRGSKRRLFGKMLIKFVKHPIQFLKKCSPTRIKKFFKTLKREGAEGTSRRLDDALIGNSIVATQIKIASLPSLEENAGAKAATDYAPLFVPQWENPSVSIVIPVYNQFDYTYLCVKSILEHSGDVSYEILIADDRSTDLTTQIDDIIHGLRTIHNEENLRFLLNCNNAAKFAKGRYILFLNNDTQVQENWLAPLVELIERDETIGLVGSKLIYPDGRLQEAGGIMWKDGSAWNYGNRCDPDAPEYNYVKEVDYISGAAIMIRKSLWEEIGGFDETFVPAYFEDADLAFEVRKRGYKVLYQPLSTVVHFEGVSNGTDLNNGQKAYQVTNLKKFTEKWEQVLASNHYQNAENVFLARDKSRKKATVLMIDHYVPMYDKDAGSRTIYQYIQVLTGLQCNVKFMGDNFFPHQPYTEKLQQMGVEVLYGSYYQKNWKAWIKDNAEYLDVVFINRPHIAAKYIDYIKSNTHAKIIYNLCDLHFLREQREYEITGDKELLASATKWQELELSLVEKADVSFTLSANEKSILDSYFDTKKSVICPIFIYDNFQDVLAPRGLTKDLLFVGGFNHTPNVDAVKWFCSEVFPLIQAELPDVRINVVGSNPPEEVRSFASDSVRVLGFVSDDELDQLYRECRICVVPLRYGAGVKGKTVEAMYHGIPLVSTSIGIEGLPDIEKVVKAVDTADDFAKRVIALYRQNDDSAAVDCYEYVRNHFSGAVAEDFFRKEFCKGGA